MRFKKADLVLRLVQEMQGARVGLCLQDIQEKFEVSRRTAQRMRDAVLRLYPQTEEYIDEERRPRWRIPTIKVNVAELTASELADVVATARLLKQQGFRSRGQSLDNLVTKLKATLKPATATRIDPDLELLLEAEGIAMRPGPRPMISDDTVRAIRMAILQSKSLQMSYRRRSDGRTTRREVWPLGVLFGNRHYLIAIDPKKNPNQPRHFALGNIKALSLGNNNFKRPQKFSLKEFSERSFGVFQEAQEDIVWRFAPAAAASAAEYMFHPNQSIEHMPDGSLIVRFKAGGLLEMCWHLITWGRDVEVLAPDRLKDMMKRAHLHSGYRFRS